MENKILPIISLIIVAIVIINELSYLKSTSLAWVIIAVAVAVGLNSINQIINKDTGK